MGKGTQETAIVPFEQYQIAQVDKSELAEILAENLGGGTLNASQLDRVKVPSGGSLFWEVPTPDGPQPAKALRGVIIYWDDRRAYWSKSLDEGGGGAPDCSGRKVDTPVGIAWQGFGERWEGDERTYHDCHTCPYSQFGSGRNGTGTACPEKRMLAILTEHSILPVILWVPVMSLKDIRSYFVRLTGSLARPSGVITEFELVEAKNSGGIKYAKIEPRMVQKLDPAAAAEVRALATQFRPFLERVEEAGENGGGVGSSFPEGAETDDGAQYQDAEAAIA